MSQSSRPRSKGTVRRIGRFFADCNYASRRNLELTAPSLLRAAEHPASPRS